MIPAALFSLHCVKINPRSQLSTYSEMRCTIPAFHILSWVHALKFAIQYYQYAVAENMFRERKIKVFQNVQSLNLFSANSMNIADVGRRPLRSNSNDTRKLLVPRTHNKLGDWSFSAAGPRLWNGLPPGLRRPGLTFDSFRQSLKTHLFGDRSA